MRSFISGLTLAASLGAPIVAPTAAQAEMVVINGRYVVAKDTVRAYFYRAGDKRTVFDVRWNDWSTKYKCDDTYARAQVEAASLNLVLALADARSLDFDTFLEGEGFAGCAKF